MNNYRFVLALLLVLSLSLFGFQSLAQDNSWLEFPQLGISVGIDNGQLVVFDVEIGSTAQVAGLRTGDIILEVNGLPQDFTSMEQLQRQLTLPRTSNTPLNFFVNRRGAGMNFSVVVGSLGDEAALFRLTDIRHFYTHTGIVLEFTVNLLRSFNEPLQIMVKFYREQPEGYLANASSNSNHSDENGYLRIIQGVRSDANSTVLIEVPYDHINQGGNYTFFPEIALVTQSGGLIGTPRRDTGTALISRLGEAGELDPDMVANAGGVYFEVLSVSELDQTPQNADHMYLLVEALVSNFNTDRMDFYDTDFVGRSETGDALYSNSGIVASVRGVQYPNSITYPGTNTVLDNHYGLEVPGHQIRSTLLVYEVPRTSAWMNITFRSREYFEELKLWFVRVPDSHTFRYSLVQDDGSDAPGVEIIDIQWEEPVVIGIDDAEDLLIENCGGTAVREVSRSIEIREVEEENIEIRDFFFGAVIPLPVGIIAARINGSYSSTHRTDLTRIAGETFIVQPNERAHYTVIWTRASIRGIARMRVGNEVINVPFSLMDRIRPQVQPVATEPCPSATDTGGN